MSRRAIALARPRVHHDALDWARRVATNGGSVSQRTLRAVSAFCDSVDRAGIRDRFYRLNLFCGNSDASLAAVRTPLYRNYAMWSGRNLLPNSGNPASWDLSPQGAGSAAIVTPNYAAKPIAGTGPDASRVQLNIGASVSASDISKIENTLTTSISGAQRTMSVWMRSATASNYVVQMRNADDILLATVTPTWQKFTLTNATTASNGRFWLALRGGTGASQSADILVWGSQMELGASATDYDPTPLGNATDTNVNFVQGDYAETGASGGLLGNDSTKYLNTGFRTQDLPGVNDCHIAVWSREAAVNGTRRAFGALGSASDIYIIDRRLTAGGANQVRMGGLANFGPNIEDFSAQSMIASRTSDTSAVFYKNGSSVATQTTTLSGVTLSTQVFGVFTGLTSGTTPNGFFPHRLCGYSVGAGMTGQQAAAFHTAWATFQTSLTRGL